MPHASDVSPADELKVYQNEGDVEDEVRSSDENLKEVKTSLVTEVAEEGQHAKNVSNFMPSSKPSRSLAEANGPHLSGKHFEYLPPAFSYVVSSPYHPHPNGPYGAISMVNRVPLVPPNHPSSPLPFMMYSPEQPPPAHMGISHLNHKTGIGRPPVYPLASPSQFHAPIFSPEFQQFSWPHPSTMYSMASGFRYPHAMPIPPPNMQNKYPGMLPTGIHNHPIINPGAKIESSDHQDNSYLCNFPYRGFSSFSPISSPLSHTQNTSNHVESTPRSRNEQKKSHIKKPLNAFMLYMKEQRPLVVKEVTLKESAAINQILGKRWHALTREEQAKYYEKASLERQQHRQRYPDWTARDNYAVNTKKKKRKRDKSQDGDGNNPKKCRARFGLDKQESWCKPCRRKKKCIAYRSGSDHTAGESEDNLGSVESLEAPTPDSRFSADDGSDSGNHELESSEFSLSSPPLESVRSVSSPTSVPRPVERVQSLNGDSHIFNIQHLTGEEGDHIGLPTPPSTDSSTTALAPS